MHLICGNYSSGAFIFISVRHALWIRGHDGHIASGHMLPSAGRCNTRLRSGTTCLKSSLENRCAHSRGHKLRYCNFVAWTALRSRRSSLLRLLIYYTDLISTIQTVHITAVHPKHNTSIKPTPVILLFLKHTFLRGYECCSLEIKFKSYHSCIDF